MPVKVIDDRIILDKTVADQVSMWKSSRGLTDKAFMDHACSGETCSYYQIGDVFLCEKTGHIHGRRHYKIIWMYLYIYIYRWCFNYVHLDKPCANWLYFACLVFPVCDDTCREAVMDPTNELWVCTISGHCFDRLLSPGEMEPDIVSESLLLSIV